MENRMKDELAVCAAKADISPGPLPELVRLKIFASPWWPLSVTLSRIIANSSRETRWPSLGLRAFRLSAIVSLQEPIAGPRKSPQPPFAKGD